MRTPLKEVRTPNHFIVDPSFLGRNSPTTPFSWKEGGRLVTSHPQSEMMKNFVDNLKYVQRYNRQNTNTNFPKIPSNFNILMKHKKRMSSLTSPDSLWNLYEEKNYFSNLNFLISASKYPKLYIHLFLSNNEHLTLLEE